MVYTAAQNTERRKLSITNTISTGKKNSVLLRVSMEPAFKAIEDELWTSLCKPEIVTVRFRHEVMRQCATQRASIVTRLQPTQTSTQLRSIAPKRLTTCARAVTTSSVYPACPMHPQL